jgi:hypothetical protein
VIGTLDGASPSVGGIASSRSAAEILARLGFGVLDVAVETMKSVKSPRENLLQKFRQKPRRIPSQIGQSREEQSALNELLAEGVVRKLDAFYLAGHEPTVDTEKARIENFLEAKAKLFRSSSLVSKSRALKSLSRSAIAELVDERRVLELSLQGKRSELVYIHRRHVIREAPRDEALATAGFEERILAAYQECSTARQRRSIPIAELVQRSGLTASEVRCWITQIGIPLRRVQLDQGDWASANEEERAAAVEQGGRKRLYIAIEP